MPRPRSFDQHTVVDAAMQAFWGAGLVATSVDDLLQATGLSRSSMYQCIGNRDTLLELAVERYVEQQVVAIERLFSRRPIGPALEKLLVDAALDNFDGRGCLLTNGVNELHACDAARIAVVRAGMARLAQALCQAIARACPRCADPEQRCVECMVAISGLRTLQRAGIAPAKLRSAALSFAAGIALGISAGISAGTSAEIAAGSAAD